MFATSPTAALVCIAQRRGPHPLKSPQDRPADGRSGDRPDSKPRSGVSRHKSVPMNTTKEACPCDAAGPGRRKTLVERFAGGRFQPLDFVLDHQFAALQLDYGQIIRGGMGESLVQFAFQNPMFTFQFNEMRLYCHTESPR